MFSPGNLLNNLVYNDRGMAFNAKPCTFLGKPRRSRRLCLCVFALLFRVSAAPAHPLEFHLDPLDDAAIERVLMSFELLSGALEAAGLQGSARISEDALGITAIVWSTEQAIASMDNRRPAESPFLLNALTTAGYEDSPYIVAEWKMEAERVWESYEVLTANYRIESIGREMRTLAEAPGELTEQQRINREAALARQLSMAQTTARDVLQVAPYRQRLDALARRLGN